MKLSMKIALTIATLVAMPFAKITEYPQALAQTDAHATYQDGIDQAKEGISRYMAGKYVEAEPFFLRSLSILENLRGPNDPDVALVQNNLAEMYKQQGRYQEAEKFYKLSLSAKKNYDADPASYAIGLSNLGDLYMTMGLYKEAEPFLEQSAYLLEGAVGPNHTDLGRVLNNLAEVYRNKENYTEAIALYKRSLKIFETNLDSDHPYLGIPLNNLALIFHAQGNHEEAEKLYLRSLAIQENFYGSDNPNISVPLNNLAEVYLLQGRYNDAEPLFNRILGIWKKASLPNHPDAITARSNLSWAYLGKQQFPESVEQSRRVLESLRNIRNMGFSGEGLSPDSALQSRAKGQYNEQIDPELALFLNHLFVQAVLVENDPGKKTGSGPEVFLAAQDGIVSPAGRAMQKAAAVSAAPSDKARNVAKMYQEKILKIKTADENYLAALASNEAGLKTQYKSLYDRAVLELAAVEKELNALYPQYLELTHPRALPLNKAQALLAPDQALIIIISYLNDVYILAATKDDFEWKRIGEAAERTAERVATLLCQIDSANCAGKAPKEEDWDYEAAYGLYSDTIGQAEKLLKARNVKRLYTVVYGHLAKLPLSTLTTRPTGKDTDLQDAPWLINDYALTMLPSVPALALRTPAASKAEEGPAFIGYGAPALLGPSHVTRSGWFRDSGNGVVANPDKILSLSPLPGTETELKNINQSFGQPDDGFLYLGSQATEGSFRTNQKVAETRVLSIATHGLLTPREDGLEESALIFTPPANSTSSKDDGMLKASEVVTMNFKAQWAILSACNTATSDTAADSLSTLARSFLFAGAESLLASHWRVDDEATSRLTTATLSAYGNGDKNISRSQALQKAAIELRQVSDKSFAHPRYWAPFTFISNKD